MKAIYLDCFAGISGNMLLGAFLDGGVPEAHLRQELRKLGMDQEFSLTVSQVKKQGMQALYVDVQLLHDHMDVHEHQAHAHHRHLEDILCLIENSQLSARAKEVSAAIFRKLAAAEAKVHGTTVDKVHFHEVGAVDSIVDIVGAAICLDYLNIEKIFISRLNVGSGFVRCAHGIMPVPAPATAELLRGIPFYAMHAQKELVTPTGAAIAAALGENGASGMPEGFVCAQIAYGAGTWDLEIPNVLRVYFGEFAEIVGDDEKKNCC